MLRKMRGSLAILVFVCLFFSNKLWAPPFSGFSNQVLKAAVDSSGNVYVLGRIAAGGPYVPYSKNYSCIIKFDTSGNQVWMAKPIEGSQFNQLSLYDLAVDAQGNVYVTGGCWVSGWGYDYATFKYDSSGLQLWMAVYNSGQNTSDNPSSLAVDSSGNVYVAGSSTRQAPDWNYFTDYVTVKYGPAGNQLWVAQYDSGQNAVDYAGDLVLDSAGNVYVMGSTFENGTSYDYSTVKYDPAGNQLWAARYNGGQSAFDNPSSLAVDSAGNVYVTGHSDSSGGSYNYDYATVKYGPAGNQLWVARYTGPGYQADYATGLALDSAGNVYVTGFGLGSGTDYDYATVKYDPAGNQLWEARYNGPDNLNEYTPQIAIDSAGNVCVAGISVGSGTGNDFATVKYDPAGNQLWEARYNSPGNDADYERALAVDAAGNVYVTGECRLYSFWDWNYPSYFEYWCYAIVKYDSAGVEQWVATYANVDDMLAVLLLYVSYADPKNGVQGMTAKLEAAQASYQEAKAHDYVNTINQLEAFKNKCDADSQLNPWDRDLLKNQADGIIAYLKTKS